VLNLKAAIDRLHSCAQGDIVKAEQHRLNKCGEKFWLMFYVFIMSTISISMLPFSFASAAPLAVT